MPACITCKVGPESLSLPAGLWIIDASVRGTREEAHRVGHSQRNELPGLGIEHFDGVGVHRSIHRCVFSQAEGIMQIHVSKVALVGMKDTVGVCRIVHSYKVQPSGQLWPVARGSFVLLQTVRSNAEKCPLARQFCHMTPWPSASTPPDPYTSISWLSGGS